MFRLCCESQSFYDLYGRTLIRPGGFCEQLVFYSGISRSLCSVRKYYVLIALRAKVRPDAQGRAGPLVVADVDGAFLSEH